MSMSYELNGTVKEVQPLQSFDSGFCKRVLVVSVEDGQYTQEVPIEFVKDGCGKLDHVSVGEKVNVAFNVRGNEWKGKYYVSLVGWNLRNESRASGAPAQSQAPQTSQSSQHEEDDVPF